MKNKQQRKHGSPGICLCLSPRRFSDKEMRQNGLHLCVLLMFVDVVLCRLGSEIPNQHCPFTKMDGAKKKWKRKQTQRETQNEIHSTRTQSVCVFSVQIWGPRISGEKKCKQKAKHEDAEHSCALFVRCFSFLGGGMFFCF